MKIQDDRGRSIQAMDKSEGTLVLSTVEKVQILFEEIERKSSPRSVLIETVSFAAAGILTITITVFNMLTKPDVGWFAGVMFLASCIMLGIAITHPRRMRRQIRKLRCELKRARSEAWFCLGCQYDLHSVVVADDGCTVCPECGAAWRVQRQRQELDAEL